MGAKLMRLANAAARYAFEHDLNVPSPRLIPKLWSQTISDAVEHAIAHPDNRYAKSLIAADDAFARSRVK